MRSTELAGDGGDVADLLPQQPVPPLEQSIANARRSLLPFLDANAIRRTDFFFKLFGLATKKPHRLLVERSQSSTTNWAAEGLIRYYLGCRRAIQVASGWPLILEDDASAKTLPARAATLVHAALSIEQEIRAGTLERDRDGTVPLEMRQYENLFGTTRVPRAVCDDLVSSSRSDHLVVMVRGRVYALTVDRDGERPSVASLEAAFDCIVRDAASSPRGIPFGCLTAMPREDWARARARLAKQAENREAVRLLDEAILVVCLDDEFSPTTVGEASALVRDGNPENRCYDRSIQLVVFANGRAGLFVEHAALDGDVAARFASSVWKRARAIAKTATPLDALPKPKPLRWSIDSELDGYLREARAHVDRSQREREVRTERLDDLGTARPPRGVSADTVAQIALQLACATHFGRLLAIVEPVQTRRFRGGRFDGFPTVTAESAAFVETARQRADAVESTDQLRAAMRAHFALVARSRMGMGWHDHVMGLSVMDHPENRIKGVRAERFKQRLLGKVDRGMALLVKWDMNAASAPALEGIAAIGNVGVEPGMIAVGYILQEGAAVLDVRADGAYRGDCEPLVAAIGQAARHLDGVFRRGWPQTTPSLRRAV